MRFFSKQEQPVEINATDGVDKWIDGRWFIFSDVQTVELLSEAEMIKIDKQPMYRMSKESEINVSRRKSTRGSKRNNHPVKRKVRNRRR